MWCYEGKQMSHYLYSRAIELGKNNTARGSKQLYLTVYSVTFITTGCICACEVKVSEPCSHESFSALMKITPGAACWSTNSSGSLLALLTHLYEPQFTGEAGRWRWGTLGAWEGWEPNRGCWWRWALGRRRVICAAVGQQWFLSPWLFELQSWRVFQMKYFLKYRNLDLS